MSAKVVINVLNPASIRIALTHFTPILHSHNTPIDCYTDLKKLISIKCRLHESDIHIGRSNPTNFILVRMKSKPLKSYATQSE